MMQALSWHEKNPWWIRGDDFSPEYLPGGDFWRLMLDSCQWGGNREIAVYSHAQAEPERTEEEKKLTLVYDGMEAADGQHYDIRLTLTVEEKEGALHYAAQMENNSAVRINELQYPLFQVKRFTGAWAEDTLVLPLGLGRKIPDPHADTLRYHTEFMAADYKGVLRMLNYPGEMSMPWMGVETGGKYFYLGAHFDTWRKFALITGAEPRNSKEEYFLMGAAVYPTAEPGETVSYDGYVAALFEGDWRQGVDFYRAWAEKSWLKPIEKKDSIRQLQGWQRIIMKHQYGEIYHTYDELPRLYQEGAKYGIHMLLLFGWWEEGMDAGYPNYRPDPAMGGEEKLKKAIAKVHEMGGRVILYANGHLIDLATDYYKSQGWRYTMKGIDGSDYQDFYKFSDHGTLLRFGHKAFAMGCFGTREWEEKILEIEEKHLALGSSGTFFDQLGCAFHLCFDKTHSHGNRIDLDPELRYRTILKMRDKLSGDQWFGTEWPSDRISPIMDFTHGCGFAMTYHETAYPHIFRYAFPEVQVTNRFLHDEQKDWEKHLNYAFVHGLMYDVSVYRCRYQSIEDEPNMAAYMKKLIDLRKEYLPFFTDGKYDLPEIPYPKGVWGARYTLNGETIQTVWNDLETDYVLPDGTPVRPGEVKIVKM